MKLLGVPIYTTITAVALMLRSTTRGFSTLYAAQTRRRRGGICLFGEQPPLPPQAVQSLLHGALSRAKRTLSEKDHGADDDDSELKNGNSPSSQLLDLFGGESATSSGSSGSTAFPQQRSNVANELLSGIASRAKRTMSTKNEFIDTEVVRETTATAPEQRSNIATDLLSGITNQAKRTLSTKNEFMDAEVDSSSIPTPKDEMKDPSPTTTKPNNNEDDDEKLFPTELRYNQNPAVSLTALAQWLWATVLRPHIDTAIDATCGNGHDAKGIASILLGNEDLFLYHESELICMDIQAEACQATREKLATILHASTMKHHVQILNQDHAAPLPTPKHPASVGLVVYNLGYLPNSDKAFQTQIDSTLSSIADALLLVRVGGMVSIMTYPGSNPQEDFAVRSLLEAVIVMTNKQDPRKWYEFIDQLDCKAELKELLTKELRRISSAYETNQAPKTFRVSEHKKIGLAKAPILMTATRIK